MFKASKITRRLLLVKLNMVEALNQALDQALGRDKSVVLLGEDIGKDGGVFRVTDNLQKKYGDQRVIDTPLAESGIVGASIGLAMNGMRPIAEIQFDGFMPPAWDQMVSHASRIRNRSRGRFTCPMIVRAPYGGGIRALEHHAESMEAVYAHTQGLTVVIPSNPVNAKGLLLAATKYPDPVIFFEPKKVYRAIKMDVPEQPYETPIGKAEVSREGADITLISWGSMMKDTLEATAKLAENGVDAEVIDVRTIQPLDEATIIASVKKTGRAVIVHEAPRSGGWGAEIAARIQEHCLLQLKAPVARVTGYDVPFPYFKLEFEYLPSVGRIVAAVEETMRF
jgi:pyruvate dehydrogenase E1 component beta subunit